ncbi:hypothetical protein QBC37DRAFT_378100 [Rhypophila decipiens]|uniref:DUF7689 domain-containing protein n=1 Tax=Rhypophila decipiens TaxID=261697 RepID=A0AAN6XYS3_9PEZI|nr:hypothetical protein QBC37DRAFT_378100 [Rhypophila decipiens]
MPRSSRSGQRELSRFERDIIADHANAAEDATNFDVQWETQSYPCNCIAWAIGVQNRQITPQTMAQLNWEYNKAGYFDVADDSYFAVGDVEVYPGSSGERVHAHQIIDTPEGREGVWASSKMGAGPVIEHPRDMLDSPKRNRPDRYVYGHIRRWFRTNPEKHAAFLAENFKTTSTGRTIPKTESEKQADKEAARRQSTRETQREPSPHRTVSGREWTDAEQYSYGYKTKSGRSHRSSRYYDDDRYGESLYGGKDYDRSEATYQPAKPEGQQVPQEAKGPKKAKTKGCYRLLCCWGRGKQKQQGQKTSQAPQTTQAPHAPDAREATKAPEAPKPAQAPQATKTPQAPQGQKDAKAPQAPQKP